MVPIDLDTQGTMDQGPEFPASHGVERPGVNIPAWSKPPTGSIDHDPSRSRCLRSLLDQGRLKPGERFTLMAGPPSVLGPIGNLGPLQSGRNRHVARQPAMISGCGLSHDDLAHWYDRRLGNLEIQAERAAEPSRHPPAWRRRGPRRGQGGHARRTATREAVPRVEREGHGPVTPDPSPPKPRATEKPVVRFSCTLRLSSRKSPRGKKSSALIDTTDSEYA